MRDLNELNVTDEVLESLAAAPNGRLKTIMSALIRRLHDFTREVELTPAEWLEGIRFLTAIGQQCSPNRQEFILLSDTLGLSTLVNAIQNRKLTGGTPSSILGPFFKKGVPLSPLGTSIVADEAAPGQRVVIEGSVTDVDGNPVVGAEIEAWQTSAEGKYDIQLREEGELDYRGRFLSEAGGRYFFRSVVPVGYPIPDDGPVGEMLEALGRHPNRPAHVHFLIRAAGHDELVTALYVAPDPYIESDTVFGVSRSLVVEILPPSADSAFPTLPRIVYDFRLAKLTAPQTRRMRVGADPAAMLSEASLCSTASREARAEAAGRTSTSSSCDLGGR
jgi:catechol 1,2-dioxygenase/hydroxyquinol 1,2-dioxygenase